MAVTVAVPGLWAQEKFVVVTVAVTADDDWMETVVALLVQAAPSFTMT